MSRNFFLEKYEFEPEQVSGLKLGYAEVLIKRNTSGWMIHTAQLDQPVSEPVWVERALLADPQKADYFHTGKSNILHIVPALPDRPVVFKNNSKLRINPKQSIRLFLKIPLWLQFNYSQPGKEFMMKELALSSLSSTWFGETDNGELAYSIGYTYFLGIDEVQPAPYEAICPVRINNQSSDPLDLERLIIRMDNFLLYRRNKQFLTSVMVAEFKGQDIIGHVQYKTEKDIHGDNPKIVSKARNPEDRNLLRKSFHFIKNISSADYGI